MKKTNLFLLFFFSLHAYSMDIIDVFCEQDSYMCENIYSSSAPYGTVVLNLKDKYTDTKLNFVSKKTFIESANPHKIGLFEDADVDLVPAKKFLRRSTRHSNSYLVVNESMSNQWVGMCSFSYRLPKALDRCFFEQSELMQYFMQSNNRDSLTLVVLKTVYDRYKQAINGKYTESNLIKLKYHLVTSTGMPIDEINAHIQPALKTSLVDIIAYFSVLIGLSIAIIGYYYYRSAHVDGMSDCWNKRAFERDKSKKVGHHRTALLIDFDNFKAVNDIKGHEVGDQVIMRVAKRIQDSLRKTDKVYRIGGDEFVVVLSKSIPESRLDSLKKQLNDQANRVAKELKIEELNFGLSIGAEEVRAKTALGEVYQMIDERMYEDKKRRKAKQRMELSRA